MLAVILVSDSPPIHNTVKISMHHVVYGRSVVVVLVIHIAHWFENNMTAHVEWHKSCGYSCNSYKMVSFESD